ncbi:MAG: hypothetical protein M3198_00660 [Actinomycetota bacterium]|nr:hypothetical protein [Actinomycetota bacterium]
MSQNESERQEFHEAATDAAKQAGGPSNVPGATGTGGPPSSEDTAAGQAGKAQLQQNVESGVEPGSEEPGIADVMTSGGMKDPDAPIG